MAKKAYSKEDINYFIFAKNNEYISKLLENNKALFSCEKDGKFFNPSEDAKIQIPSNTIKQKIDIIFNTKLNKLNINDKLSSNISYMFQFNDLVKFMIVNFNIYGPLENVLIHYAIINNFSIIETITKSLVKKYRDNCKTCVKQGMGCKLQKNIEAQENFCLALETIKSFGFISLTDDETNLIIALKKTRDDVHVFSKNEKFYQGDNLSKKEWIKSLNILYKFLNCLQKTTISTFQCPDKKTKRGLR